jgi:glycine cleavage system H protein
MNIPDELRYTSDHEWAQLDDSGVRIGITDFAQEALGDIVFIDLPKVGTELSKGDKVGEVESTKSVSEVYSPISGQVILVNEIVTSSPETINSDPYGQGWFCVIAPTTDDPLGELLDASSYRELTLE